VRIVDLSNWTKVDWGRILKTSDYAQLFSKSRRKLNKDKINKKVISLLHDGCGSMVRRFIYSCQFFFLRHIYNNKLLWYFIEVTK